jgi:hypothetical protein
MVGATAFTPSDEDGLPNWKAVIIRAARSAGRLADGVATADGIADHGRIH